MKLEGFVKRGELGRPLSAVICLLCVPTLAANLTPPLASEDLVFEEVSGVLAFEAEHFYEQTRTEKRAWHITSAAHAPLVKPDADPAHVAGASGGAYVEILPDTRATARDKLINGENFSNEPGQMAVLHYKAHFQNPGRYFVWVRAFSTGAEDNGVHMGLDGQWPASGQRWQTVQKQAWAWDSKQRTQQVHTGEPFKLFLDVEKAGEHEIQISLREDGFEMDKVVLASSREFKPEGQGPVVKVKSGQVPAAFPEIAETNPAAKTFPSHWGAPPAIQTRDIRDLPDGYGRGSSTLARWIQSNLDKDAADVHAAPPVIADPAPALIQPRASDGRGEVTIAGERRQWHKITLTLDGPFAHELDSRPNPFTDYDFTVTFRHESGEPHYVVPGYFAADGDAANTSAESGTKWRAHLSPDKPGKWSYAIAFRRGPHAALGGTGVALEPFNGRQGSFQIAPTDKTGRDFRACGRLQYVGKHHLQFADTKEYFLKAGADAPETLLAYADFDNTTALKQNVPLKTWQAHVRDWTEGDPAWKGGKGKGLIGALNYLAAKGMNVLSFLTYNAGGDGNNVWPFVSRNDKLHWDCSKLDQWGIVFDHATARGLYLHFKLQENEIDDDRRGKQTESTGVPESLDGGKLGPQRKLYCRELIARFAHNLALNWNVGEENTQSTEEINDMINFIRAVDPYRHHVVIHTFIPAQDKVYTPLLGDKSQLTGASLQNNWIDTHRRTLKWVTESADAGRPWVVANDEQGGADTGVPPDLGYEGYDGRKKDGKVVQSIDDIRKATLWGNLMAGGAGVEYYFGYQLPQNDLVCEDFRSRDKSWDYGRFALEFFRSNRVPFQDMKNVNGLIGNLDNDNSKYCLGKPGEVYIVFLANGGTTDLDLAGAGGRFTVQWFNPRAGGLLQFGPVKSVNGGRVVSLGQPPADPDQDWVVLVRR